MRRLPTFVIAVAHTKMRKEEEEEALEHFIDISFVKRIYRARPERRVDLTQLLFFACSYSLSLSFFLSARMQILCKGFFVDFWAKCCRVILALNVPRSCSSHFYFFLFLAFAYALPDPIRSRSRHICLLYLRKWNMMQAQNWMKASDNKGVPCLRRLTPATKFLLCYTCVCDKHLFHNNTYHNAPIAKVLSLQINTIFILRLPLLSAFQCIEIENRVLIYDDAMRFFGTGSGLFGIVCCQKRWVTGELFGMDGYNELIDNGLANRAQWTETRAAKMTVRCRLGEIHSSFRVSNESLNKLYKYIGSCNGNLWFSFWKDPFIF